MKPTGSLPAVLAAALKHIYGCGACDWRGALIDCLDAAEHGLLCPHCFGSAGRIDADAPAAPEPGPRYASHRSPN